LQKKWNVPIWEISSNIKVLATEFWWLRNYLYGRHFSNCVIFYWSKEWDKEQRCRKFSILTDRIVPEIKKIKFTVFNVTFSHVSPYGREYESVLKGKETKVTEVV
jgi:hypothetical protein